MDNYIVSARKYRPVTFDSVVGQSHITSTLKNAISRKQLAHAYLFCGPRGVGKTTCARIFAKAINCLNPVDSEACGNCESCRAFNEGRSFNIHELDAASNNSVEDIRTLTEQVRIPPQIGHYSVYIIDEVHMLSQAAFNAFLKTLEEPPSHAVFILATTEKHKIIPTILSRCQIYDFNRIRVEDGVEYLRHIAASENISYDDESLNLIAAKADGGMRDALSMFDKAVAFCGTTLQFREVARTLNVLDYDTYFNLTGLIAAGDYRQALLLFDDVLRKGFSAQTFISGISSHIRDLLMCKDPSTLPLLDATGNLLERYKQQSSGMETKFLFDALALVNQTDSTLRSAINSRLHVELALMKLCGMQNLSGDSPLYQETKHPLPNTPATQPVNIPTATIPTAGTTATNRSTPISTPSVSRPAANGPEPANKPMSEKSAANDFVPPPAPEPKPSAGVATSAPPAAESTLNVPKPKTGNNSGSISGVSISGILHGFGKDKKDPETTDTVIRSRQEKDPDSEKKIMAAKDEFLDRLKQARPRLATAFLSMQVSGNKISTTVPTELLREDIFQNQKELSELLREVSGVSGPIEYEITVRNDQNAIRPIKPEDKLAHLRKKNAALDQLRKELDLEIE